MAAKKTKKLVSSSSHIQAKSKESVAVSLAVSVVSLLGLLCSSRKFVLSVGNILRVCTCMCSTCTLRCCLILGERHRARNG